MFLSFYSLLPPPFLSPHLFSPPSLFSVPLIFLLSCSTMKCDFLHNGCQTKTCTVAVVVWAKIGLDVKFGEGRQVYCCNVCAWLWLYESVWLKNNVIFNQWDSCMHAEEFCTQGSFFLCKNNTHIKHSAFLSLTKAHPMNVTKMEFPFIHFSVCVLRNSFK